VGCDDEFPVVVDDRHWLWLAPPSASATVGQVADALRACGAVVDGADGSVWVDGRTVARDRPLRSAGVRAGSRWGPVAPPVPPPVAPLIEVTTVAGEGSGTVHRLGRGRHLLGGAEGVALQVSAVGAVAHAGVVEVRGGAHDVEVTVTPLSGPPLTVGGRPIGPAGRWPASVPLALGPTALTWHGIGTGPTAPTGSAPPCDPGLPWWRTVQRHGRLLDATADAPAAPDAVGTSVAAASVPNPSMGPALMAGITSGVLAVVLRQPVLALVGLSSFLASGLWWLVARGRRGHRRRQHAAAIRQNQRFGEAAARRDRPSLPTVMAMAQGTAGGLWERRPHRHADVWQVVLGQGRERVGDDTWWHDVPVAIDLGPGARVGLAGAGALALARSVLAQLITQVGPADLSVRVVGDPDDDRLADLEVIPHRHHRAAHELVVILDPGSARGVGAGGHDGAAWLVIDARTGGDTLDASCSTVVRWDARAPLVELRRQGSVVGWCAPAGVTAAWFHELVRALVVWRDAEADGPRGAFSSGAGTHVAWAALHGTTAHVVDVVRRWSEAGEGLPAVLGSGVEGVVTVDLVRHGPHALVAGTTGSGKSEALRTLVASWAWFTPPDRLQFVLVDFKGGAAFDACGRLPHVAGVVTDLDGDTIARVLAGLRAELTRREQMLRREGLSDVVQWPTGRRGEAAMARLVIVVDEVAALVQARPDVVSALVSLAQRGRSLGLHLVLATQRPAGVVRDDVRANTELRICLRVADRADALDVVADPRPAAFDRGRPGRALMRTGADDVVEVQVADTSTPWGEPSGEVQVRSVARRVMQAVAPPAPSGASTLSAVVGALETAAHSIGFTGCRPLWQPPLPGVLAADGVGDRTVVGLLDDVEQQRRVPLRCDPSGHALIIGGPRSGVTHTIHRIVGGRDHDVVTVTGAEPCVPVMERLVALLDERRSAVGPHRPVSVVIDGVGVIRRRWEHELGTTAWQATSMWDRLLSEGPPVGIVVVAGADRVSSCGTTLMAVATTRWLMRPLDPLDAPHLGVRWPPGDVSLCPPGRLVDVATGLVGQVAFSTPSTMCTVRSA